jgi:hypothetical protein
MSELFIEKKELVGEEEGDAECGVYECKVLRNAVQRAVL